MLLQFEQTTVAVHGSTGQYFKAVHRLIAIYFTLMFSTSEMILFDTLTYVWPPCDHRVTTPRVMWATTSKQNVPHTSSSLFQDEMGSTLGRKGLRSGEMNRGELPEAMKPAYCKCQGQWSSVAIASGIGQSGSVSYVIHLACMRYYMQSCHRSTTVVLIRSFIKFLIKFLLSVTTNSFNGKIYEGWAHLLWGTLCNFINI